MKQNNTIANDMTVGSPTKLILTFSLPLIAGNIFQLLYTIVDTMVVGKTLGVNALAALGTIGTVNWLTNGIALGFTQGFGILIAQNFGRKDEKALKKTVINALLLSAVIAVCMLVLIQLLIVPILMLLRVPEEIRPLSELYLRILIGGLPIVVAYNIQAVILRSLGDSKAPFRAMVVATITNVILDILFVVFLGWGIPGAAIATLIAQLFSAVFCFRKIRKMDLIRFKRSELVFEAYYVKPLLKLGAPLAVQNMIISMGGAVLQSIIDGFGVLVIAGATATNKLYGILECAALAYGYAMTTYVGQNYGARDFARIRKGVRRSMVISLISCMIIASITIGLGQYMLSWFIEGTPEEMEITLGYAYKFLCDLSYFLMTLYLIHVLRCVLQGMGHTAVSLVSGGVELVIRIIAALTLPVIFGPEVLFYAHILAWIGSDLVLIAGYFYCIRLEEKKAWTKTEETAFPTDAIS